MRYRAPRLADLVELSAQQRRDADLTLAELRTRDRAIGLEIGADGTPAAAPRPAVLAWLDRVHASSSSLGQDLDRGTALVALVLAGLGLLAGCSTAGLVLRYDGTHPVNVMEFLAILVGLQLVALGLTVGLMIPGRRGLAGALQETLSVLSPGRWLRGVGRWLPQAEREALAQVRAEMRSHGLRWARCEKWFGLVWSQHFALAFNLGALAVAGYLVVFTDLAFGWSTTLTIAPESVQRLTDALAAPWAAWLPEARPSQTLIEGTRYFRLGVDSRGVELARAEALGGWWPFVVACLVVYGLAPRLVLWLVARWRLRRAVVEAFRNHPAFRAVAERMSTPLVTMGTGVDTSGECESMTHRPMTATPTPPSPGRPGSEIFVVQWAEAGRDDAPGARLEADLGARVAETAAAGGASPTAEDQATARRAGAWSRGAGDAAVVILTKSWEPPLLEFLDFVVEIRAAAEPSAPIGIIPLARPGWSRPQHERAVEPWRRQIAGLGDPFIWVRRLGGGAGGEAGT